jgi:ADP-ribose pyrophosphatase YjhB (NUDIX family)
MIPNWLKYARELQAAAQTGLTYAANKYEKYRYEQLADIAARMMSEGSGEPVELVKGAFAEQKGYCTPKIDVRGCIFRRTEARKGEVLLVSEIADGGRWTFPGGFSDPNEGPSASCVREVREEAGLVVSVKKLCGIYDRDKRGGTSPYPFHIYKLFFLCEVTGTAQKSALETGDPKWFPVDALPELSWDRTSPWHIARMYEHFLHHDLPADWD